MYEAGKLGFVFGGFGSLLGGVVGSTLSSNTARIPATGAVAPIPAQGALNPLPAKIGNSISNTVGTVPAFISLDNGEIAPFANAQEQTK